MLIILEGPDGAGKTTLAAELTKRYHAEIINHGPYLGEDRIFHRYAGSLMAAFGRAPQDTIFDRSWISEPIYGNVMRDGVNRIGTQAHMLERAAMGLNAVVILCLPPWKECKQTFAKRALSEYPRREEQLQRIWEAYRKISTAIPLLVWDYTRDATPILMAHIAMLRVKNANLGPGVGLWRPGRVSLVVGERQNTNPEPVPAPWVFVGDEGCSPWLADRLEEFSICENELYWVNALRPDGSTQDMSFVKALQPIRTVAMGKVATGVLADQNVPAISIEHPQSWKRFHWADRWVNLKTAFQLKGSHDLTFIG